MKKKIIIWSGVIIIISNLPIVNEWVLRDLDPKYFQYSNADASLTKEDCFFLRSNLLSKEFFEKLIEINLDPTENNMEVFRLYRINPLCFWRWKYYWTISREFRYKSWKEIEQNRVPYATDNPFQDF